MCESFFIIKFERGRDHSPSDYVQFDSVYNWKKKKTGRRRHNVYAEKISEIQQQTPKMDNLRNLIYSMILNICTFFCPMSDRKMWSVWLKCQCVSAIWITYNTLKDQIECVLLHPVSDPALPNQCGSDLKATDHKNDWLQISRFRIQSQFAAYHIELGNQILWFNSERYALDSFFFFSSALFDHYEKILSDEHIRTSRWILRWSWLRGNVKEYDQARRH